MRNIKRPPRNSDFQNMKILSAPLARRRRENFEVFGYFVWISKGVLNSFVWNLKILSAPQISRDFEKILSAPLRIQISRKINIKPPPNLVPAGGLKGGASNILWTVVIFSKMPWVCPILSRTAQL